MKSNNLLVIFQVSFLSLIFHFSLSGIIAIDITVIPTILTAANAPINAIINKIIFITEKGKYQITFSENKQGTGEKIPNNEFTAYAKGDYIINKNQFELLGEIINSSSLKAAVYTTNNTVLEITEYGNRAKQTYNEFYNYYVSEGLSNLTDSESEILIIKK